ncbi:MAG: hypothetical protein LBC90_02410 [Candidatus Adiutrix sp.]|jgi:hypothetical protein|nr:hypothetical protein [Candidatus Adiutrix sp.]
MLRSLLKDKAVLALLDEIESIIGYQIQCQKLPDSEFTKIGMPVDAPWIVLFPEPLTVIYAESCASRLTDGALAHELFHAQLRLEGWPLLMVRPKMPAHQAWANMHIAVTLNNTFDHLEVFRRLESLGFADHTQTMEAEAESLLVAFEEGRWPPEWFFARINAVALGMFPLFVLPCRQSLRTKCLEVLARSVYQAEVTQQIQQIAGLFENQPAIGPDNYHPRAMEILKVIGLPEEGILLRHFPNRAGRPKGVL